MNQDSDRRIATWIWVGLGSIGCGGIAFVLLFVGGLMRMIESRGNDVSELLIATPPALLVVFGIVVFIGTLIAGFNAGRDVRTGPTTEAECWIVSRFALNEAGEMIFDHFPDEGPAKMFVTIRSADGQTRELQSTWEVFGLCGEGMHGRALIQGKWICGFSPIARPAPTSGNPYVP